jgi:hypothetical protein
MAATAAQSQSPETQRGVSRRSENHPARDIFSPGGFQNLGPFSIVPSAVMATSIG